MYQTLHEKQTVVQHLLKDDGRFPNNEQLPLLIYPQFFDIIDEDGGALIEQTFRENGWLNTWQNGIYDYHHYHSTTHEVLGIAHGSAVVHFGGPSGVIVEIQHGDIVIIPAGVAHKCLTHSHDFKCVGGYPRHMQPDMNEGKPGERPLADYQIRKVPLPDTDPVFGADGPLLDHWKRA